MKLLPHRGLACLPLLIALLLVSCRAPAARPSEPLAAQSYKIAPSNAAFNLNDEGLKVAWRQEFGQTARGPLAHIYAASHYLIAEGADGQVHVYDSGDYGTWKASAFLKGGLQVPPVAFGSKLILTSRNRIFTLDVATRTLSKGLDPEMALSVAPLVYQDSLVLAGSGGDVARLRMVDGEQQWIHSVEGPIFDRPVIDGEAVYAAAQTDSALALQLEDGKELWKLTPTPPAKLNSGVAVYGKTCYVGDNLGNLYGLRTAVGSKAWSLVLSAPVVGAPQVVGGKVLVCTSLPDTTCLKGDAGKQVLWTFDGARSLIAAGSKFAYFLTDDGAIAAVSLEDGRQAWRDPLPDGTMLAGSAHQPEFYVANRAGSIVAIAELE